MAEAVGKGKEMAEGVGEGKERQRAKEEHGAETSGVKEELYIIGDYEQGYLEVWKGSAERRGNEYQLIRDAPTNLPCLRWWLQTVAEFVKVTGLEVPKHDKVRELPTSTWRGTWKMKALLQFQAVAHATGIMHPPRTRRQGSHLPCGEQREFEPSRGEQRERTRGKQRERTRGKQREQTRGEQREPSPVEQRERTRGDQLLGSNEPASPGEHQAQAVKHPSTGKMPESGTSAGVPEPSRGSPIKLRPVLALPAVNRERTTTRRRQPRRAAAMAGTLNFAGWCRSCRERYSDGHILHCPYSVDAPQVAPSEAANVVDLSSSNSGNESDDFDMLAEMAANDFLDGLEGDEDAT